MDKIKENESFFVNGVGQAIVTGEHGKMGLIHLQSMNLEMSSEMQEIMGGPGNFPLAKFQTAKNVKASFKNASMSLDTINATQGVQAEENVTLFTNEIVTVGADGSLPLTYAATADLSTLTVYGDNDNVIEVNNGKVDTAFAGLKVGAVYAYTTKTGAVGTSVKTTSVPGYVTIFHKSNPIKQKNGRTVQIYTTIYKARSDGSLKIDYEQKSAYAPELTFELVDPERADNKYISFAVVDVTDGVGAVAKVDDDTDIKANYVMNSDLDRVVEPTPAGGSDTVSGGTGTDTTAGGGSTEP